MKKILLTLFVSFLFVSFSHAGGDDRDELLPINTLNKEADEIPRFLQEDVLEVNLPYEDIIQTDVNKSQPVNQKTFENVLDNSETKTVESTKNFISDFFETDRGILLILIFIVAGLILLFNFFFREKNN